jgi:hypothetical protein
MMARGGKPGLNWIEDQLILLSWIKPPKMEYALFAAVHSFLEEKFPDIERGRIEEFIKTACQAAGGYVAFITMGARGLDVSRTGTLRKYRQLLRSLNDVYDAFARCAGPSWELIRHVNCRGRPSEGSPMQATFDALDVDRFSEQLIGLIVAVSEIIMHFNGTAQDRTRPERYLVHQLWSKWVVLGFPEPRLVRGADALDADAPDEDAFVETVRLVFDTLYRTPKPLGLDNEVTYAVRAVIEAGRKKLRARK